MKILKAIDKYLADLGIIFAGIVLSLLAVGLMLFPGLVFTVFLVSVFNAIMDADPYVRFNEFPILILMGIASWYLGMGVGKITKRQGEDGKV